MQVIKFYITLAMITYTSSIETVLLQLNTLQML